MKDFTFIVVEYAISRTLSPVMAVEYKLQLPDKALLQKKLRESGMDFNWEMKLFWL